MRNRLNKHRANGFNISNSNASLGVVVVVAIVIVVITAATLKLAGSWKKGLEPIPGAEIDIL